MVYALCHSSLQEEVRDLLFTDMRAPRPVVSIRELPTGVSLAGAIEKEVHSKVEMLRLLEQGSVCRAVASTNMNNRSSRSHAIFTITLEQRRQPRMVQPSAAGGNSSSGAAAAGGGESSPGGGSGSSSEEDDGEEGLDDAAADDYLIAKMHLVDLAGSERAKRTGAEGARLKEAININKGLLALAKVISALVDNQAHVPYR
jgi:kinesin family protein 4/21/27